MIYDRLRLLNNIVYLNFRSDPAIKQYNGLGKDTYMFAEPINVEEPDDFDDKPVASGDAQEQDAATSTTSHSKQHPYSLEAAL